MRIKYYQIREWIIFFLIICNLSIVKIFPLFTRNVVSGVTLVLSIALVLAHMHYVNMNEVRYSWYIASYSIFFITVEVVYSMIRYNNSFINAFAFVNRYISFALAPIIIVALMKNSSFLDDLLEFILCTTTISCVMRILLSFYWTKTGKYLFSDMIYEFWGGGTRLGTLRVNFPCFITVFVPVILYRIFIMDTAREKTRHIVYFSIVSYFVTFIQQSRVAIIWLILMSLFMWIIKRRRLGKKMLIIIFSAVCIIAVLKSSFMTKMIVSFDRTGALGYSTITRINGLAHYGSMYMKNPILGIGYTSENELATLSYLGTLSDLGILGGLFKGGGSCINPIFHGVF